MAIVCEKKLKPINASISILFMPWTWRKSYWPSFELCTALNFYLTDQARKKKQGIGFQHKTEWYTGSPLNFFHSKCQSSEFQHKGMLDLNNLKPEKMHQSYGTCDLKVKIL
jgi:hypothetical protein